MGDRTPQSITLDVTLEDGAWKDSFDKLLEPRPILRELNILKRDVHASFNRDSSVENSIRSTEGVSDLSQTSPFPIVHIKQRKCGKSNSISTPVGSNRLIVNPFKCSLSPIGAWRLHYFDKGKNLQRSKDASIVKEYEGPFNGTPINPIIEVIDYDQSVGRSSFLPSKANYLASPSFHNKHDGARTTNSRHVCFKSVGKSTRMTVVNDVDLSDERPVVVVQQRLPSLTLQPGKWRKSFSVWRRTNVRKISSSTKQQLERRNSSVEFIGFIGTVAGHRKSIYLKPERLSESICTTEIDDAWKCRVLERCKQRDALPFNMLYAANKMPYCLKIGEGAYGEVFLNRSSRRKIPDASSTVMKVIPIEGKATVNGELQKTYEQILSEIVISMELSDLRNGTDSANFTTGFVNVKKIACVQGRYPEHLVKSWEDFDNEKGSENEHPRIFDKTQIFIVLELEFCGSDLESFQFQNAEQAYFALLQIVLTLAVAEHKYQFEHRDLHWGNVLVLKTSVKKLKFTFDNRTYTVPTKGIKVTLIDYTLSRMTFDNCCHYNDLACDEELFTAMGDYQFDIYRMMRDVLSNNWEAFEPRTNVFWISYIITKMVDAVKYKNTRNKTHTTYMAKFKDLMSTVLDLNSAIECTKFLMDTF